MDIEQTRQQAQDENTAPEVLAELAESEDIETRQYVAGNPNTPTEALLKLGAKFSRELLNNPIFDLLILEDIDFVNKIPLPTLRSILRQQDVPEYILEQAVDRADLEIQLSLIDKVTTSRKVLQRLIKSPYPEVVEAAELHINFTEKLESEYKKIEKKAIEARLHTSGYEFNWKTLRNEDLELLAQICPIPTYLIDFCMESKHRKSIETIAKSSATPTNILERIAKKNTPEFQNNLKKKYGIFYSRINLQSYLAENSNISSATLFALAQTESVLVRKSVAKNTKATMDIINQLAKDKNESVRYEVANNPNTPPDLLKTLSKQAEPKVQEVIEKYHNFPTSDLEKLAIHEKVEIRQAVAKHPDANHQILEILAGDKIERVRACAMSHPNLTKKSIEKILCGKYAAEYPKYNPDYLKNNPDSLEVILNYYARSQYELVSYIALLQPQISQQILEEQSGSLIWLNRFAVAQNINTSAEILTRLKDDWNQLIRAAAKDNLEKREESSR